MATLQELMAQRAALDQQIEDTKNRDRSSAIAKVKALMAEYGLTVADLNGDKKSDVVVANKRGVFAFTQR